MASSSGVREMEPLTAQLKPTVANRRMPGDDS